MTTTGLDAMDRTVHKTNEWLAELMKDVGTDDRKLAYSALRAVLHALRDRLPIPAIASLGAQLPLLVRGIYYEGWHPPAEGTTSHVRTVDDFLVRVEQEIANERADSEELTRAVLRVLDRHVDPNELRKVMHLLPKPIQALFGPPVEPRDS